MIIGLFTDLLPAGGIPRVGRHTAAVVAAFAAQHRLPCRFLSLNDALGLHTLRVGESEFSVSGYGRAKPEFVLSALRTAFRGPLLVFALHPHLAPVVALMKLRSRRFRSIIFAHGIEVWQPLGWPRGAALRRTDLVTAPSQDTARHLAADQKILPGKIRPLAWGLDPEFEQRLAAAGPPARPRAFPEGSRIILTVGRWNPADRYKGADTLISAVPNLLRVAPDACLVLVGEGQDRPRLEELAQATGVADQTRFLYGLSQEELFACYAHCDVFALPSRGEGFGLVFLEAMAHGKPVIGGAHGGTPDVVEDGVTGLLVPHGDVTQLARAIESLLTDPARAIKMGERGRERIRAMYTFERFRSRLMPILQEALAR